MQEIGCAGCTVGLQAEAVLVYNNADIGKNKVHIEQSMKDYWQSMDDCIKSVKQNNCCCICDLDNTVTDNALPGIRGRDRMTTTTSHNN